MLSKETIWSISPNFSDLDQSYDDDCDGKLVIAEHEDDTDIKPDELMDGSGGELLGKDGKKPRRKHNRFNGIPEEEVLKRLLPDLICPNLDILIVSCCFFTSKASLYLISPLTK